MVEAAPVDMYCKCGGAEEGWCVFDCVHRREVVLWNSVTGELAMNGHGERELELFQRMLGKGFVHNQSSVAALCTCTHTVRVNYGRKNSLVDA